MISPTALFSISAWKLGVILRPIRNITDTKVVKLSQITDTTPTASFYSKWNSRSVPHKRASASSGHNRAKRQKRKATCAERAGGFEKDGGRTQKADTSGQVSRSRTSSRTEASQRDASRSERTNPPSHAQTTRSTRATQSCKVLRLTNVSAVFHGQPRSFF